jgi:polyamine oxidase
MEGSPFMTSLPKIKLWLHLFLLLFKFFSGIGQCAATSTGSVSDSKHYHKVLILGGGVAGVIAARTLHQNGIDDFLIVDALDELGGRLMSQSFAGKTMELGASWVQGTQTGNGPANPIFELVKKHNITTQFNDWFGSISTRYFSLKSSSTGSLNLLAHLLFLFYFSYL